MDSYPQRVTRFFLQSIHTLKKESGGQRWNEICDNTVYLSLKIGPTYISSFSQFQKEELWQLFFHPPETIEDSLILQCFTIHKMGPAFIFLLLQALTDPPNSWWQELKN